MLNVSLLPISLSLSQEVQRLHDQATTRRNPVFSDPLVLPPSPCIFHFMAILASVIMPTLQAAGRKKKKGIGHVPSFKETFQKLNDTLPADPRLTILKLHGHTLSARDVQKCNFPSEGPWAQLNLGALILIKKEIMDIGNAQHEEECFFSVSVVSSWMNKVLLVQYFWPLHSCSWEVGKVISSDL